jgi:hypothetical protein
VTNDPRDARDLSAAARSAEVDPLHGALKALPAPRAPRTLLPRVMAAAEARRRQPGIAPWFAWPMEWRLAAAAAVVLIVGSAWLAWPAITLVGTLVVDRVAGAVEARAMATVPGLAALAHLATLAWEMVVQPALGYVLVWIVVMCTISVAIGAAVTAALGRAALGEASQ